MTTVVIDAIVLPASTDTSGDAPQIGYQSICPDATITASTADTGFAAANVADGLTWDYWKPQAGDTAAWIAFDNGSQVECDYIGIAAHNLGTVGATVALQFNGSGTWQTIETITPADDRPIFYPFAPFEAQEWRIALTGYSAQPSIGIINIGSALTLQRNIYVGHTPITMGRRTEIKPNVSNGGQFLGRSIERRGASTTVALQNLTPAWYRASFEPFVIHALTRGFFFAWRPETYPTEVAYCWTTEDIRPVNQRNNGMMSVSFSIEGLTE